jgi:peroxiredoxin
MVLTKTPICNFGENPHSFSLKGVDEKIYKLEDCLGKKGTIIMFICNHCPYVKAIIKNIVEDTNKLKELNIKAVAIMSNDTINYPEDSFERMKEFSKINNFNFPYVIDTTQEIAKKYGAVCTPDFFGYNGNQELQYRGRMRELKELQLVNSGESDLYKAMKQISETGKGPEKQIPSMGCNIKWFN